MISYRLEDSVDRFSNGWFQITGVDTTTDVICLQHFRVVVILSTYFTLFRFDIDSDRAIISNDYGKTYYNQVQ